jgi:hypothetical protein
LKSLSLPTVRQTWGVFRRPSRNPTLGIATSAAPMELKMTPIGQFEAGRNSTGFHPALDLREEKPAPAIVAKQMVAEIRSAVRPQVEGVGVSLLDIAEAPFSNRGLKRYDVCVRLREFQREFGGTMIDLVRDGCAG